MKIPIILISTAGKTKEQVKKEFMRAWKRFLTAKKKVERSNQTENKKSDFLKNFSKGKSYQIMGQCKPKEKKPEEKPDPLIDWLRDAEQIPEEGESVDEFLERTNWTLEEENKWRKIDGLPLLKSKEEYQKLFEEKN